jgi:hypothetical protein
MLNANTSIAKNNDELRKPQLPHVKSTQTRHAVGLDPEPGPHPKLADTDAPLGGNDRYSTSAESTIDNTIPNATDPFANLAGLRMGQDYAAALELKRPVTTVPVRKPSKTAFIWVHPDEKYRLATAVVEIKEDSETYIVMSDLWPKLVGEPAFVPKVLVTYLSRPGNVLAIWPIRLPGSDGRIDDYNRSALEIATGLATQSWVRVNANRNLGAYEATVAPAGGAWGKPQWPEITFEEILRVAFKNKIINSWDHPVLQRLRGEK